MKASGDHRQKADWQEFASDHRERAEGERGDREPAPKPVATLIPARGDRGAGRSVVCSIADVVQSWLPSNRVERAAYGPRVRSG